MREFLFFAYPIHVHVMYFAVEFPFFSYWYRFLNMSESVNTKKSELISSHLESTRTRNSDNCHPSNSERYKLHPRNEQEIPATASNTTICRHSSRSRSPVTNNSSQSIVVRDRSRSPPHSRRQHGQSMISLFLTPSSSSTSQRTSQTTTTTTTSISSTVTRTQRPPWSSEVGVFLHWGLYSVPAFDCLSSARRRIRQNGSEWYYQRLFTTEKDRFPTSGWKETQAEHTKRYGPKADYFGTFMKRFTAQYWDPEQWMNVFAPTDLQSLNHHVPSYVVLTARHHDGFCLWPTSTTRKTITHTTASTTYGHSDLCLELATAVRKRGLRFGIYYSWFEFDVRPTMAYFETVVKPQLRELTTRYQPDIFWFDGDWKCKTPSLQKAMNECVTMIRKLIPHVEINDRIGCKSQKLPVNALGNSNFRVYDDRALPDKDPGIPWEHCNTIGISWGHFPDQEDRDYKSVDELTYLHRKVTSLGGRFLLNFGPDSQGLLDPKEEKIWRAWLKTRAHSRTATMAAASTSSTSETTMTTVAPTGATTTATVTNAATPEHTQPTTTVTT